MPEGTDWAVLFQDEAVFGLRTETAKVLTLNSIRAVVPASQRFGAFKIYASVEPLTGRKVMMRAEQNNTATFRRHLRQISRRYRGKMVLLVLDQAGWHTTPNLKPPKNVVLAFLPPYCPELNPVENLWMVMKKDNKNKQFADLESLYGSLEKWTRRCIEEVKSACGYNWIVRLVEAAKLSFKYR